ncbi:MAG: hypothetical protein FWD48_06705 [Oscillospiraceae bacterium]|nr:hypothetical protein [Oscillospiraceae bacterium]
MKKLVLIAFTLILFASCAAEPLSETLEINYRAVQPRDFELPSRTAEELESISDEEMIAIALELHSDFVLPEHHTFDDFGVPLKEGRGWPYGEQEEWGIMHYSAASREEVEQSIIDQLVRHDDENVSIEYSFEYIGENDYYYAFRSESIQEVTEEYSELLGWNGITRSIDLQRIIVFKSDVVRRGGFRSIQCPVGDCICDYCEPYYSYFPQESLNFETVLHILDLETFTPGSYGTVIHREFAETDSKFVYTYYRVAVVWHPGVGPEYAYMEVVNIYVDKNTGNFGHYTDNYAYRQVKGVGIPPFN